MMYMVIYGVGVLVAGFLCGLQMRMASEPLAQWQAIAFVLAWPVWFVAAWITVLMIGVPSLVIGQYRKYARVKVGG